MTWAGDLITGSYNTHIATLVGRQSRFVLLVKVDGKDRSRRRCSDVASRRADRPDQRPLGPERASRSGADTQTCTRLVTQA